MYRGVATGHLATQLGALFGVVAQTQGRVARRWREGTPRSRPARAPQRRVSYSDRGEKRKLSTLSDRFRGVSIGAACCFAAVCGPAPT